MALGHRSGHQVAWPVLVGSRVSASLIRDGPGRRPSCVRVSTFAPPAALLPSLLRPPDCGCPGRSPPLGGGDSLAGTVLGGRKWVPARRRGPRAAHLT